MANHKSALKRARQNALRRERNRIARTRIKSLVKQVRTSAADNINDAGGQLNQAKSVIDKAAKKGVIHKNTAARKISRLARLVNQSTA